MQHERQHVLLYPNLDFEYAMMHGSGWNPPRIIEKMCSRWRHLLRCLPELKDIETRVWDGKTPIPPEATLHAWGIDHRVRDALSAHRHISLPSAEAIAIANDKRHALSERARLGIEGLRASREVTSTEELERASRALASEQTPWMLKHPMGVSGRERMTSGTSSSGEDGIDRRVLAWASKHFDAGWGLVLEPRVEITREYSLHADISIEGAIIWRGWCHLMADPVSGTHRGHRIESNAREMDEEAAPARIARWRRLLVPALKELARRGYHGPVSIDGWVGTLAGEEIEQPLSEINARYTFGRMALELERFVPEGHDYAWHHPRHSEEPERRERALERSLSPGCYRLPEAIDPGGESGTWVEVLA